MLFLCFILIRVRKMKGEKQWWREKGFEQRNNVSHTTKNVTRLSDINRTTCKSSSLDLVPQVRVECLSRQILAISGHRAVHMNHNLESVLGLHPFQSCKFDAAGPFAYQKIYSHEHRTLDALFICSLETWRSQVSSTARGHVKALSTCYRDK